MLRNQISAEALNRWVELLKFDLGWALLEKLDGLVSSGHSLTLGRLPAPENLMEVRSAVWSGRLLGPEDLTSISPFRSGRAPDHFLPLVLAACSWPASASQAGMLSLVGMGSPSME